MTWKKDRKPLYQKNVKVATIIKELGIDDVTETEEVVDEL